MGDVAAHALSPFSAKVAENGSPFLKKLGNHFPTAFLRLWFVPFDSFRYYDGGIKSGGEIGPKIPQDLSEFL